MSKDFNSYKSEAVCHGYKVRKDVYVEMRDGQKLCIDIVLPDMEGPFPALLSFGQHNKELLDADLAAASQQPHLKAIFPFDPGSFYLNDPPEMVHRSTLKYQIFQRKILSR